ncbi:MAG: hypothetical protein QF464_19125, partial [Myxococcota bacterium]|nr:hypothetical protein [Myxococcota bacterium]
MNEADFEAYVAQRYTSMGYTPDDLRNGWAHLLRLSDVYWGALNASYTERSSVDALEEDIELAKRVADSVEHQLGLPAPSKRIGTGPDLSPAWRSGSVLSRPIQAFAYLPAHVHTLGVVASPKKLLALYEVERLVKKYAKPMDIPRERKRGQKRYGFDLYDLSTYTRAGLDLNAPAGAAMLEIETETGVFFLGVSNRQRVLDTIRRAAAHSRRPFEVERGHDATILCWPREHGCFVLRGKTLLLVFSDDGEEHALRLARLIADLDPSRSLSASKAFREAGQAFSFGEDLAAYVHPGALLAEARRSGQWRLRGDEEQIANAVTSTVQWLALGATVDKRGARLRLLAAPRGNSPIAQAFRGQPSTAFVGALGKAPTGLVLARLNPAAVGTLWADLLEATGDDSGRVNRDLRRELGLSVEDILGLVSGVAGYALTLEAPQRIRTLEKA